jgi:hypothetical protein
MKVLALLKIIYERIFVIIQINNNEKLLTVADISLRLQKQFFLNFHRMRRRFYYIFNSAQFGPFLNAGCSWLYRFLPIIQAKFLLKSSMGQFKDLK